MVMLGIKLLLRRDGKFSSQHVHDNPALRKKKIHCVIEQDREARNPYKKWTHGLTGCEDSDDKNKKHKK